MCVCLSFNLPLSLCLHLHFSLNLKSPFGFRFQVRYLCCVYLQNPHAIINHWHHHVNLTNHNRTSPSLSLSLKMNNTYFGSLTPFGFLFVTSFVYFVFVSQHHLHHPSSVVDLCLFMFTSHCRRNQWQWWCWWKRRWMTLTPCDALTLKKILIPNSTTKLYTKI